mgnify:CR=1 FL=1
MTQHNMSHVLKRQLGYTIDQTILIVAVIAILVTMIIGSVGWDLLSRAGGTKLQSHLVQMENSAGSFFAQYGLWPTDVTDDGQNAMLALIRPDTTWTSGFSPKPGQFRTYLPAYDPGGPTAVEHSFGAGGEATIETEVQNGQTFLVYTLTNVPSQEYLTAEEGIDGDTEGNYFNDGRLQASSNPESSDNVTLQYFGNVTN